MAGSHIRADLFSEFIQTESSPAAASRQAEGDAPPSADVVADTFSQEQLQQQLLQILATHGGTLDIAALLSDSPAGKLSTLKLLSQLQEQDFVNIIAAVDHDQVQLTPLGQWATQYLH